MKAKNALRARVLPKLGHGFRPGQCWMDERGRVLWVQRVCDEVGRLLCFVLNATGGMRKGACPSFARLQARASLVKDAPARTCSADRCKRDAVLLDGEERPFCSTECWATSKPDRTRLFMGAKL